jgi:hypothetical protein
MSMSAPNIDRESIGPAFVEINSMPAAYPWKDTWNGILFPSKAVDTPCRVRTSLH